MTSVAEDAETKRVKEMTGVVSQAAYARTSTSDNCKQNEWFSPRMSDLIPNQSFNPSGGLRHYADLTKFFNWFLIESCFLFVCGVPNIAICIIMKPVHFKYMKPVHCHL